MNTISVITICYNNLPELQATIASIDSQSTTPYEHIIVDGSSNDQIKNYLTENNKADYRRWISEKDEGISDAFNKGILMAKGTIVQMLNSGDSYYDSQSLEIAAQAFQNDATLQWLHTSFELYRGHKWVLIGKPFEKAKSYRGMRSLCHQSMLVKKSLHDQYGLYDKQLKIAMDYDFVLRIASEKFIFIDRPTIKFAPGGASSQQYKRGLYEMKISYEKYNGASWKLNIWQWRLRLLHFLMQTKIGKLLYRIKTSLKMENV